MKKIKKLFILLIAIMFSGLTVACDKPEDNKDDGEKGEKQVSLTYAAWGDPAAEQAMLDAFMEAHPNIKVTLDTSIEGAGAAFTENLVAAAQAGILPDVFVTDNVPTVIDKGLAYDVNDLWNNDDDAKKVFDNISTAALYGDVRLAVPSYQFIKGIFVNKTLLTKLGIEIPEYNWTWDEFYEICQDITDIGTTADGKPVFAISGYWGAVDWEQAMAAQDDNSIGYDTWNGTKFNYNNESWIKYRNLTNTFRENGLLEQLSPEDKEEIYGSSDAYPFGEGSVAFGIDGSWNASALIDSSETNGFDVEFYPYPAGQNGQKEPVILDFMCVSSQTSFPEEAYELLKWMSYGKEGWTERLQQLKESGKPLDRYPVIDDEELWNDLNTYMEGLDYNGMTAATKIIGEGIPDVNKWLPGYIDFWNYVIENSEEQGWNDMSVEQLARDWTVLVNDFVDDAYERLGLTR